MVVAASETADWAPAGLASAKSVPAASATVATTAVPPRYRHLGLDLTPLTMPATPLTRICPEDVSASLTPKGGGRKGKVTGRLTGRPRRSNGLRACLLLPVSVSPGLRAGRTLS